MKSVKKKIKTKRKQRLSKKSRPAELLQFNQVLQDPAFIQDPLSAIKEHVLNVNAEFLKADQEKARQAKMLGLKKPVSKKKKKKKARKGKEQGREPMLTK